MDKIEIQPGFKIRSYVLTNLIADSETSQIYEAQDTSNNDTVAIKIVLQKNLYKNKKLKQMLAVEVQVPIQKNHLNNKIII